MQYITILYNKTQQKTLDYKRGRASAIAKRPIAFGTNFSHQSVDQGL